MGTTERQIMKNDSIKRMVLWMRLHSTSYYSCYDNLYIGSGIINSVGCETKQKRRNNFLHGNLEKENFPYIKKASYVSYGLHV